MSIFPSYKIQLVVFTPEHHLARAGPSSPVLYKEERFRDYPRTGEEVGRCFKVRLVRQLRESCGYGLLVCAKSNIAEHDPPDINQFLYKLGAPTTGLTRSHELYFNRYFHFK